MVKKFLGFLIGFAPVGVALAQTPLNGASNANNIIDLMLFYISRLMVLIIAFGVLTFVYGVIKYIASEEEVTKSKAKNIIINAVIALVAATSIWGIVAFVRNTIGTNVGGLQGNQNVTPCVPGADPLQGGC